MLELAVEHSSDGETEKPMPSLFISRWSHGQGPCGPGVHGVVVFFMHLTILTVIETSMTSIIYVLPGHDTAWAEGCRYSGRGREAIQPKKAPAHHLNDHSGWYLDEWQDIKNGPASLFDGPDEPFYFWNVFIT